MDSDRWDRLPPRSCAGLGDVCIRFLLGFHHHSLSPIPDHDPNQNSSDPMENPGELTKKNKAFIKLSLTKHINVLFKDGYYSSPGSLKKSKIQMEANVQPWP